MCRKLSGGFIRRPLAVAALILAASFMLLVGAARGQTVLLSENFDSLVVPDLPPVWSSSGSGWATSTSSPSTGSGLQNLTHTGATAGSVVLPILDLTSFSSATISYLARRTSSYPADSLKLTASTDGGTTFPFVVVAAGAALPVATSTYTSISSALPASLIGQSSVIIRLEASGGSTGGSNIRIDDFLIEGTPSTPPPSGGGSSSIGFGSTATSVLESSSGFRIPLDLSMVDPDSLHGLQLSIVWSSSVATLASVVAGAAVVDTTAWSLDWSASGTGAQLVLLSQTASGIPPGAQAALLELSFDTAALASAASDTVVVSITSVVGSLADAVGTDAGLSASPSSVSFIVMPREAHFTPSSTSIDLGRIPADSSAVSSLSITNTTASQALVVSGISSSNTVFSVSGTGFTLAPDSSISVSVTFSPTATSFGLQTAQLTFTHNGAAGPASIISVSAVGTGGRGDVDGDGMVELLDVVTGIDAVLGRRSLTTSETGAIDTFPFPTGDGSIDVRDLTILVQSVVRGSWPDLVSLPVEQPPAAPADFPTTASGKSAVVQLRLSAVSTDTYDVMLDSDTELRGFELVMSGISGVVSPPSPSFSVDAVDPKTGFFNADSGILRFLLAHGSGASISPGAHFIGRVTVQEGSAAPVVAYATALSENLTRIRVLESSTAVQTEIVPELPTSWTIGFPYPNPIRRSDLGSIVIPISWNMSPEGTRQVETGTGGMESFTVDLFDVLGRRLALAPDVVSILGDRIVLKQDHIYPSLRSGTYIVRVRIGALAQSRILTILP